MYVPVILGTGREGRQSEKVARFVLSVAKGHGFDSEILDVRDFPMVATDNSCKSDGAKKLSAKVKRADALIVVVPEYNHGYPGELKLMLDSIYEEYKGKPLGICGVSAGPLGGARAVEQLRLVAVELRMPLLREALYFASVQDLFDEKGEIKDKDAWGRRAKKFFDELSARIR
ncbi:MAG: NAD(P)H-dependent oxidoreductase [Candidatus Micrarchaeota archaeon]